MIWKILQYVAPSPLSALIIVAMPTYAWLALGGSLFYR